MIVVSLPLAILAALLLMRLQGLNANIMRGWHSDRGGGDGRRAIQMIENVHKRMERPATVGRITGTKWGVRSSRSAALFFSLSIITLSFLPAFTLQAQEGKLFAPLAFTKNLGDRRRPCSRSRRFPYYRLFCAWPDHDGGT